MSSEKYVSRGGDKLEGALEHFKIDVVGLICLDVGASTGGFTDCLIQRGAERVYAVDTAYGELAWKLRQDSRVVVLERTNILYDREVLQGIVGKIDLVTVDAGWTKSEPVVSEVGKYLKPGGKILLMIKPQYQESNLARFESKSVRVLDKESSRNVAQEVAGNLKKMGFLVGELFPSTVKGDSGNQEYFVVVTTWVGNPVLSS